MADYVSSLTGVQMDAALLDMAEHNSEAYAVGERNGIAVASDDVTYHNNARYYAQIASSQIVGDASSAVRWDTDQSEALTSAQKAVARNNIGAASDSDVVKITSQTLTSAQQSQARANIMAGGSNRNLLDNPWFTVNQRGYTNNSASSDFVADRWFLYGAPGLTVTNSGNGLVLTGSGEARLRSHYNEKIFMALYGQTLTFSIKINGKVYSVTGTVPSSYPSAQTAFIDSYLNTDVGRIEFVAIWQISTNIVLVYFRVYQAMTIQAVKLELGSVSTLANDTPPDYGEELAKCQRYFVRLKSSSQAFPLGFGVQSSSTAVRLLIPTPVEMIAQPTVSFSGTHRVFGGDATSKTVTSYSVVDRTSSGIGLIANISSGTFAENKAYILYVASGGYLDLSADL